MKQTIIVATLMLVIGLALGYHLAPKVIGHSATLQSAVPDSVSLPLCLPDTSQEKLATAEPRLISEPPSAEIGNALTFFAPSSEPSSAVSYTAMLEQLNYDDQQRFQQLNHALMGMFEFDEPRAYATLLAQGMPTVEELRVLFDNPVKQQWQELANKYKDERASGSWTPEVKRAFDRHSALLANRAIDEFLAEYRYYNIEYQDGPITDLGSDHWPTDLKSLYQDAFSLYVENHRNKLASAYIANLKFEQLLTYDNTKYKEQTNQLRRLVQLAKISQLIASDSVYNHYATKQHWSDAELLEFLAISETLER